MTRWGQQERPQPHPSNVPTAYVKRHPDLDDLPPLPADFEATFMRAAERIRELAHNIKGTRDDRPCLCSTPFFKPYLSLSP